MRHIFNFSASLAGIMRSRTRRMLVSYAPDWIITIGLAAVFFSLNKVSGFKRDFSLTDTSLMHPFAVHERIPNFALYIISFVAPIVIMPIINLLTVRSWWDFHHSFLGLVLALTTTGSITQFVKITVGRPRPDVIARCVPPAGSVDPPFGLSTVAICTNTDFAIITDGWRSFPSGHASLSFAGLGFLTFYLAGKLHLFDGRGMTIKTWTTLAPLAGASLVAISRTMDYRHHWSDVLVGSILGLCMSYFCYRQYFRALNHHHAHITFDPRIQEELDSLSLPVHHSRNSSRDVTEHPVAPYSDNVEMTIEDNHGKYARMDQSGSSNRSDE